MVACCCISARSTGRRPSASTAPRIGEHRGGYDPFTFDITDALRPGPGAGTRRRRLGSHRQRPAAARQAGAQAARHLVHRRHRDLADGLAGAGARRPHRARCDRPDIDAGTVRVRITPRDRRRATRSLPTALADGERGRRHRHGRVGQEITLLHLPTPSSGRPTSPFLYDLRVTLVERRHGRTATSGCGRSRSAGTRRASRGSSSTTSRSSSTACSTRAGGRTGSTPRRPTRRCASTSR